MNDGPFLLRLARSVLIDVRQGGYTHPLQQQPAVRVLTDLGELDPALLVGLVQEIARHVDDAVVARIVADIDPADIGVPEVIAREAHRLAKTGDRRPWVTWGNVLYSTLRTRRRRQQQGG